MYLHFATSSTLMMEESSALEALVELMELVKLVQSQISGGRTGKPLTSAEFDR